MGDRNHEGRLFVPQGLLALTVLAEGTKKIEINKPFHTYEKSRGHLAGAISEEEIRQH